MTSLIQRMFASVLLCLAVPLFLWGQRPVAGAVDPCATTPAPDYALTAEGGSPVPEPSTKDFSYTLKNDTNVLIRLENINPYALKCTVSTSSTAYKETAVASFLGLIGGVAGSVGGGGAGSTPVSMLSTDKASVRRGTLITPSSNLSGCQQAYLSSPLHQEIQRLEAARLRINTALTTSQQSQNNTLTTFNSGVSGLVDLTRTPRCSETVQRAQALIAMAVPDIAMIVVPPTPPAVGNEQIPLDQAINQVATQSQSLIGHLNDNLPAACAKSQDARPYIDEDAAFLSALATGSGAAPSGVETWRTQLKALNTVRANILNAESSIAAVLAIRQNFTIDTSIHGNQEVVTYTINCNNLITKTIPGPDGSSVSVSPAPPAGPPAGGGGSTPPPTSTWKHDFKFGVGPRFVLAGGLVISPLQQITFNTTATPGGSGASVNTIIRQQNSSTRILPIAMLHGRFWDMLPAKEFKSVQWIPNYISVGVTAKASDNKGTNVEYLFGPSWAFADRQLFLTAGAYAGQQQRLANSLMVGSTTSLSGANLPITQTTIWKAGFAITWAPAGK